MSQRNGRHRRRIVRVLTQRFRSLSPQHRSPELQLSSARAFSIGADSVDSSRPMSIWLRRYPTLPGTFTPLCFLVPTSSTPSPFPCLTSRTPGKKACFQSPFGHSYSSPHSRAQHAPKRRRRSQSNAPWLTAVSMEKNAGFTPGPARSLQNNREMIPRNHWLS